MVHAEKYKNKIRKEKGKIQFENKNRVSRATQWQLDLIWTYKLEIIMRDKYTDALRIFRKIHVQIWAKKISSWSNKCFAYK